MECGARVLLCMCYCVCWEGSLAVLTLRFTILFSSSSFYNMHVAQRGARRQTRVLSMEMFEYLFRA